MTASRLASKSDSIKSDGIILVDKPSGMTSFDVIRVLRKKIGVRKMGHAGTLDPLATGLLIIGIGDSTRELATLIGLPKTYDADILLGIRTDTGDVLGRVVEERDTPTYSFSDIEDKIATLVGELHLPVPIYSAIKRSGRPLYDYARKGETIDVPVKRMVVTSARLISYDHPIARIRFSVSSGTYIRSLAEELARRLGTVGTIKALRRISIGEYKVDKARELSEW